MCCAVPLHICIRKVIAHLHREEERLLLYGSNKLGVVLLAKAYLTPDLSLWISIQRAGTRKVSPPPRVRPFLFGVLWRILAPLGRFVGHHPRKGTIKRNPSHGRHSRRFYWPFGFVLRWFLSGGRPPFHPRSLFVIHLFPVCLSLRIDKKCQRVHLFTVASRTQLSGTT